MVRGQTVAWAAAFKTRRSYPIVRAMDSAPVQRARDLTCSLCAILVRRARAAGGEPAVRDLLRRAGSSRSPAYLEDVGNWISHDEAIALFDAAAEMTQDPLIG